MSIPENERGYSLLPIALTNVITVKDKLKKARKEQEECMKALGNEKKRLEELLKSFRGNSQVERSRLKARLDRIEVLKKKLSAVSHEVRKYEHSLPRALWGLEIAPIDERMHQQEDIFYSE